jgi:hypothetical protein
MEVKGGIRMKKLIFVVLCLLVGISIVAAFSLDAPIGLNNAKESVRGFIGKPNAAVDFKVNESVTHGKFYMLQSEGGEFYVNMYTGDVERAIFNKARENSGDVRLSLDQAEAIAKSYAVKNYRNFTQKNMLLTRAELQDYGTGKEHLFIWSEVINNIETPNKVLLTLNPNTGEIITYIGLQRQVTVPLEPKILKDDAVNIAASQFKDITIQRTEAKLSVEYPVEDVQKLTWIIEIEGKPRDSVPQGGLVVIDATTGEVIVVKTYL